MSQPNAKREASAAMAMSSNERPYAGAPFRKVHWAPRDIEVERRRNGEIVLRSRVPMQAPAPHLPHWLSHWAAEHPERTWLAQRRAVAVHRIEGPGLLGGASRQPLQPVHAGLARQQLAQSLGQGSGLVHRRGLDAGYHHWPIMAAAKR